MVVVVVSSIPSPSSFLSSLSPPPSTPPPPPSSPNPTKSSPHLRYHLRPSFSFLPPSPRTCSPPRHVTCASGPPSPVPEDPLGKDSTIGLEVTFYKIRDGMQIFFSVLFWMSIFFWACAWDGRDNTRPRKGSRFRR